MYNFRVQSTSYLSGGHLSILPEEKENGSSSLQPLGPLKTCSSKFSPQYHPKAY